MRKNGAQVAQLVEHCTENAGVGGSIPPLGTIFPHISMSHDPVERRAGKPQMHRPGEI